MICPQCKAEYRAGFTRCVDCEVELAQRLEAEESDPFCEFWRGEDARVFAELRGILKEAGIAYCETEFQDHLFNRTRFPEFRLGVPYSKYEEAERAVAEAYGAEESEKVLRPSEEHSEEYRELLSWSWEEKRGKAGRGLPRDRASEADADDEESQ
jgi:hypothetical protein